MIDWRKVAGEMAAAENAQQGYAEIVARRTAEGICRSLMVAARKEAERKRRR